MGHPVEINIRLFLIEWAHCAQYALHCAQFKRKELNIKEKLTCELCSILQWSNFEVEKGDFWKTNKENS